MSARGGSQGKAAQFYICFRLRHAVFWTQLTARVSRSFNKVNVIKIILIQIFTLRWKNGLSKPSDPHLVLYDTNHSEYMESKLKEDICSAIAKNLNLSNGKYYENNLSTI